MMDDFVRAVLMALASYLVMGIGWLLPFHRFALPAIDESARGASWGFKILISPGLITLWPVILWKWNTVRRGGNPHGRPDAPIASHTIRKSQSLLMKLIAIAIPLLVAAAILNR